METTEHVRLTKQRIETLKKRNAEQTDVRRNKTLQTLQNYLNFLTRRKAQNY